MKDFIPLKKEIRTHIPTDAAAFYLNRRPQTLRTWACYNKGIILPIHIGKRLAWPVAVIRDILARKIDYPQ